MVRLSRRGLLAALGGFAAAALFVPACCFFRRLFGRECGPPSPGEWTAAAAEWWRARQRERETQRAADRAAGRRPAVPFPRPYLACGKAPGPRGTLADQVRALSPGLGGDVIVTVTNGGNAASWYCCVDLYEGPADAAGTAFSAMKRCDRKIVAVLPGERRDVFLKWGGTQGSEGALVARCFDPVLDPACPDCGIRERKCEAAAWRA